MRMQFSAALAALLAVSTASAETENTKPYSRRNPVVDAVKKTQAAIVTIRIPRQGSKDSTGTGVVVDPSGLIITNRHVVGANRHVKIVFSKGQEATGQVIAAEGEFDLALVQVNGKDLPYLKLLADQDDPMVGESVIAIGHPYGYTNTVSTGIISALNREISMPSGDALRGLIQTTAPINPGNSGGPLLNINGELIGINVALRDGAQNIAFAINAATVDQFLTRHIGASKVAGVFHGLKCDVKTFAEVGDRQRPVVAKAPAQSQVKPGDEIIAVGDHRVISRFDVERALWDTRPGQKVPLKVNREGQEIIVELTLVGSNATAPPTQVTTVQPSPRPLARAENYWIP